MQILWISAEVRELTSARSLPYHDIARAATQRSVMDIGSRKGQEIWNIISETGLRRESVGFAANYRVREGEAWRCLYPAVIRTLTWYRALQRLC